MSVSADGDVSGGQIRDLVCGSGFDLVVLRYPASRVDLAYALQGDPLTVWQADTLVRYSVNLLGRVSTSSCGAEVLEAVATSDGGLPALVRAVFAGYGSHYAANPWLSPDQALEGYVEWAETLAGSDQGACLVFRGDPGGAPVGFAALQLNGDSVDVALAGIHPDHRGRGAYGRLLGAVEQWAVAAGFSALEISTQAGNGTVIRAWESRGYRFEFALNTLHLMHRGAAERVNSASEQAGKR